MIVPLVEPPTALPIRAPAAALPAIAPRFRALVEPAMMASVLPWTAYLCPATVIEVSPRSSMARSPLRAGLTAVTVPVAKLPAGIPSRPFNTDPLHELPALAVSEVRGVSSVTSIDVPEGTVRSAARWVDVPADVFPPVWATCCSLHPDKTMAARSAAPMMKCVRRMNDSLRRYAWSCRRRGGLLANGEQE